MLRMRRLRAPGERLDRRQLGSWRSAIIGSGVIRPIARKLVHRARRARGSLMLRVGQIGSLRPLSRVSGFDRGTPIDRYYIERFLAAHSDDIRGRVLEVGDDAYSRRFGGDRVTCQDVLHIDRSNPRATIVGDLGTPGVLPPNTFNCIILTQTLQYVFNLPAAMRQIRDALRAGGVALITVPGVAPICDDQWGDSFYWRFSEPSLTRLLTAAFDPASVAVAPFGNVYAASLFLHGAAVEEASKSNLQSADPAYAIVVAARAVA